MFHRIVVIILCVVAFTRNGRAGETGPGESSAAPATGSTSPTPSSKGTPSAAEGRPTDLKLRITPGKALAWSLTMWLGGVTLGVPTVFGGLFLYVYGVKPGVGILTMAAGSVVTLCGISYGSALGLKKWGYGKQFLRDGTIRFLLGALGTALLLPGIEGNYYPVPLTISGGVLLGGMALWGLADVIRTPVVINRDIEKALKKAGVSFTDLDAIAVTAYPGLIGSLLIGVLVAKTMSFTLQVPLIGINHIEAHLYSVHFNNTVQYPILGIIVSGGHTLAVISEKIGHYEILGSTLDDAVGEAFDKVSKHLDLGYPGGPAIEKTAKQGKEEAFSFPDHFWTDGKIDTTSATVA